MAEYRMYLLNRAGLILSGFDANYASDEDACTFAKGMRTPGTQAEVWQGAECMGRFAVITQPRHGRHHPL
jgi:hypothetical protein